MKKCVFSKQNVRSLSRSSLPNRTFSARDAWSPEMLDALRVLLQGDDVGDDFFMAIIAAHDELELHTHGGVPPGLRGGCMRDAVLLEFVKRGARVQGTEEKIKHLRGCTFSGRTGACIPCSRGRDPPETLPHNTHDAFCHSDKESITWTNRAAHALSYCKRGVALHTISVSVHASRWTAARVCVCRQCRLHPTPLMFAMHSHGGSSYGEEHARSWEPTRGTGEV